MVLMPDNLSKQALRSPTPGNAMTEYALIGLLVLGGLTFALANLGSGISNQFLSILGTSQASSVS